MELQLRQTFPAISTRFPLIQAEARSRDCTLVYLHTFTFQAPDFYRCLGYTVATTIEGFPDGIIKFLMTKRLG